MATTTSIMWEILVPTVRNNGRPYRTRFHRVWDERVKNLTGGLTVVAPVKGTWVSPNGDVYRERMIPVRIMCDRHIMEDIAEMTKVYYEQEAVMVFKVSDEAIIF